ncbi:transcription elongation factor GreA [Bradyrhizobium sp. SYSU BS000235]|uniref:transcription elongation factor GreA n=1 Tax=Bradyrhizobium sp. SYSU BS000235 TaxID=3411332 RepID=UPI003C76D5E0
MSRAFVKEPDGSGPIDLPELSISEHPNDVTVEGLAQIEAELARAHEALDRAQAESNAESDAQARAARDVRYWEARRATAHIVPNADSTEYIRFGHTVKLARDDGREQTFRIVGEDESDPAQGKISHVAPLARALFGKSVGDVVRAGAHELEVLDIR